MGGQADELPEWEGHPSSSGELAAAGWGDTGGAILAQGGVEETDLQDAGGDILKWPRVPSRLCTLRLVKGVTCFCWLLLGTV